MSLNYDFRDIKDHDKVCYIKRDDVAQVSPVTYAICMLGIPCGYSKITVTNVDEVFRRIHVYEKTFGTINNGVKAGERTPHFIKANEVQDHIGLKLNTSDFTTKKFHEELGRRMYSEHREAADKLMVDTWADAKGNRDVVGN